MIPYIGCVSREDAEVLKRYAEKSSLILEFGAGASTQIFVAYSNAAGYADYVFYVHTVEHDPLWVGKTQINLRRLGLDADRVKFIDLADLATSDGQYDTVFVDGDDELRLDFAIFAWPKLKIGGAMLFHDTRRKKPHGGAHDTDIGNACTVAATYSNEVDRVIFNESDSNTTAIIKRAPLPYVNWQQAEGRTDAQMGLG